MRYVSHNSTKNLENVRHTKITIWNGDNDIYKNGSTKIRKITIENIEAILGPI